MTQLEQFKEMLRGATVCCSVRTETQTNDRGEEMVSYIFESWPGGPQIRFDFGTSRAENKQGELMDIMSFDPELVSNEQ